MQKCFINMTHEYNLMKNVEKRKLTEEEKKEKKKQAKKKKKKNKD